MLKVLDEAGITEGTIGLVSAQAGVQSCVDRVDGFCKALEGTDLHRVRFSILKAIRRKRRNLLQI